MEISAEHPRITLLDSWLNLEKNCNTSSRIYYHILIHEKTDINSNIWDELFTYINHAHEGARQALRAPLEDSLHPLQHNTNEDPAFGYPHKLNDTALKGFFGEIIAGIVAEYYVRNDEQKWEVPVYLFRTHIVAFQQLETMKQTDSWERKIVGRTGDDGLAFTRDENGHIVSWLACEAKCTGNHSSTLVQDNHLKLSQDVNRPVDLLRMIDALKDYRDDEYSRKWIEALRSYWWEDAQNSPVERFDFSMYICGQCPRKKRTWISTNTPHSNYTAQRNLTCVEFHLANVDTIVNNLYKRMENNS